jgi:hypothetical protein
MREDKNKKWELVESNVYAAETELQELLAESPEVISMDEIRPGSGPLVAVVREFSLPVGYIDILAFTARGDIAIIECKLEKNPQAKREVIGQILDYSAHLWGMSYEDLDQKIQSMKNCSLVDLVREHAGEGDWNEEEFRANVQSVLDQGNFILTIAVNEINDELHRIIRYVNSAGEPAFSFAALEMKRFNKSKVEMLIPHVFGPVHASVAKPKSATNQWNETSFFEALRASDPSVGSVARQILEWATPRMTRIWWGKGSQLGSFVPVYNHHGRDHQLFAVYTYGAVEIYFQWYQYKSPFDNEEKLLEILRRLNEVEGVKIPVDAIKRRPSIKLSLLSEQKALEKFLSIFDWMLDEIRKSETRD